MHCVAGKKGHRERIQLYVEKGALKEAFTNKKVISKKMSNTNKN